MKTVTVKRDDFLEVLQQNKGSHVSQYNQAMEARRSEVRDHLANILEKLDKDQDYEPRKNYFFPIPSNQESEYDKVIKMVEMSVHETIELDGREFDQFVMDNWHWKDEFMSTTSAYLS